MKLEEKRTLKREEFAELLKKLGEGVKERGVVAISGKEVPLPQQLELEVEYKEKHGRNKIEIEAEWHAVATNDVSILAQTAAAQQTRQKIANVSQVPIGRAINFDYRGTPAVLIRLTSGEFRAYSAICTHKGERVEWQGDKLLCPEHGAIFDPVSGAALRAPAHEPLSKIEIEVIGEEIFAV